MSRTRLINRSLNPLLSTLPEKFQTFPPHQVKAIQEIIEAFDNGVKVVVLDAPTGSGKTVIAEVVRKLLDTRGVYVCHNKELQAQFKGDFEYSEVLYGRGNYTPDRAGIGLTCEDCTWTRDSQVCNLCPERTSCPYVVAKQRAVHSVIPVLNSSYWLNEVSGGRSAFANSGLCILDEVDTLESVLMGQVSIGISVARQRTLKISPPSKLTKEASYVEWGRGVLNNLLPRVQEEASKANPTPSDTKLLRVLRSLVSNVQNMVESIEQGEPWVYTGGAGSNRRSGEEISFKPVKVSREGEKRIWSKDKRFLVMSGTIISPGLLMESLGFRMEEYSTVSMESSFHPRNRQVVIRPVALMTRKGQSDDDYRRLEEGVRNILGRSEGRRGGSAKVLIHTVSYSLAERMYRVCKQQQAEVFTYRMASERSGAISNFKRTVGSILVAPSADRGVDLPGDLCRVQIICKVPYLSLGDKQISERLYNTGDGKVWYNVQVARTIMQMVGRGVRNVDDYCVTYVLDKDFVNWYRNWGHLFPKWFKKGIRFE